MVQKTPIMPMIPAIQPMIIEAVALLVPTYFSSAFVSFATPKEMPAMPPLISNAEIAKM